MTTVRLYPYRTAGAIHLRVGTADGVDTEAPAIVVSTGADARLEIEATLPPDLDEALAPSTGPGVRVLVRLRSRSSQLRRAVPLAASDPGDPRSRYRGVVSIDSDEWFGRVGLDVVAVLAEDVEAPEAGYAFTAGSVIAASDTVSINLGEVEERTRGRNLAVEWCAFSEGADWLRANAAHLFAVEPSDPPTLWLNTDVRGAYQLLTAKGRHGIRARVRDVVFAQIAHQVWSQLLTTAFAQLGDQQRAGLGEEDGVSAIDELGGWNRAALLDWLSVLYPEFDTEGGADQLLEDVRSPLAADLVLRRVSTAVQEKMRTADRFAGILRDSMLQVADD